MSKTARLVSPIVFDALKSEYQENLQLRTNCPLSMLRDAYELLYQSQPVDGAAAIKFALDPLGRKSIDPTTWSATFSDRGWLLISNDGHQETVIDPATVSLLDQAIGRPKGCDGPCPKIMPTTNRYLPETVFSAKQVKLTFNVPRSTFQYWCETGLARAGLKPIHTEKIAGGQLTCTYRDLQPFLRAYAGEMQA